MRKGDRVRVRAVGDTGWLVDLREMPTTWTYRRPDPPSWRVWVEFADGGREWFWMDEVEPIKEVVRGE